MIKYNNSTINDWNFDTSNIKKVYRNNAVCYYKITTSGGTSGQTPCYAVVDDISQYSDTEFENVFNKADEAWYKLNNLNQYEKYGVYGSGRTSCEGSASRLPQGYTEVEYIENTGTSTSNGAYLNLGLPLYDAIGNSFQITSRLKSEYYSASGDDDLETIINSEGVSSPYYGFVYRYAHSNHNIELASSPSNHATLSTTANTDGTTSITISCNSTTVTDQVPLGLFASYNANYNTPYRFAKATIYSFTVVKNGTTVRDLVPAKRDSDSVYGVYDLINDVFYTSPNGNNFSGGEPITPTVCVTTYEGKLTIDDGYEYMYSGGSWVNVGEVSGSTATLPDVPFTVNYNANNYNSSTKTLLKTEGQLANVDAVITAGTPTVSDGYLTIASGTRATISGYQTYFNRDNNNPNLTIISKQNTNGNYCHMFANRDSSYNWMYRCYSNKLTLHGSSETGQLAVTTQPVIESVRINSSRLLTFNNYTDNTSATYSSFNYGSTNSGKFAIFQGYGTTTGENFVGDFYWIYMSQNTLTDEQVQQVIDYNEGGGGQPIYPLEYVVREDPPNNLTFSSMTEAEEYECPWVGMKATIDGDKYVFSGDSQSGYEWVYNPSRLPQGYTEVEYIRNSNYNAYINTSVIPYDNTSNRFTVTARVSSEYHSNLACATIIACEEVNSPYYGFGYRYKCSAQQDVLEFFGSDGTVSKTSASTSGDTVTLTFDKTANSTKTMNVPLYIFGACENSSYTSATRYSDSALYSMTVVKNNETVRDFVPARRDSDSKYGLYDLITDTFYTSPNGNNFSGGNPV